VQAAKEYAPNTRQESRMKERKWEIYIAQHFYFIPIFQPRDSSYTANPYVNAGVEVVAFPTGRMILNSRKKHYINERTL
jgi:hypothetical protein